MDLFEDEYVKSNGKTGSYNGKGTYQTITNTRDPRFVKVWKPGYNPFLGVYILILI